MGYGWEVFRIRRRLLGIWIGWRFLRRGGGRGGWDAVGGGYGGGLGRGGGWDGGGGLGPGEGGENFRKDMRRWQLLQPRGGKNVDEQSRAEVLTGCLRQWVSVMISAKTAQMQSENRNDWPSEVPWAISELHDMPVVLWLKRQW